MSPPKSVETILVIHNHSGIFEVVEEILVRKIKKTPLYVRSLAKFKTKREALAYIKGRYDATGEASK